ncbi:MAG: lipopolysaccharide biosynthesis protein [Christensenellales bacterium]|jgi:O-antigen/teichoic acid export membrane protein
MRVNVKALMGRFLKGEKGRFAGDLVLKSVTEVLSAVFGVLTFSLLSRALNQAEYAVVNQSIAMSALLAPVILIKINNAYCIFLPSETDPSVVKSRFFSTLLVSLPVCAAVFFALFFGSGFFSGLMFNSPAYSPLMPYMALYFVLLSLSTLIQDFFRATGRMKTSSIILIVKTALLTGALAGAFVWPDAFTLTNVIHIYWLVELAVFAIGFVLVLWRYRGVKCALAFRPLREYYAYSLPLMPYVIMSWLSSFVDRFMLTHLMDLSTSGVYSFYASLLSRAFFLNLVLSYTLFPYIAKNWNLGDRQRVILYLRKTFNLAVFIALPMISGIVVTAPTLVELLGGGNYPVDRPLMLVLCVGMLFQMFYTIFSYLIDLSRKTAWYNVIFLVTCVIKVGLTYLLIPYWGMMGAALATMLTYILQFLLTMWVGMRTANLSFSLEYRQSVKAMVCTAAMTAAVIPVYGAGGLLRFALAVCAGVAVYFGLSMGWSYLTRKSMI